MWVWVAKLQNSQIQKQSRAGAIWLCCKPSNFSEGFFWWFLKTTETTRLAEICFLYNWLRVTLINKMQKWNTKNKKIYVKFYIKNMSRLVTKPTKWHVRPVKTQPGHPPSLIRVFTVRMKKAWVLSYPLSGQRRLWSDWADAQADLSLRWAQSLCWFCHVAAHIKCVKLIVSRGV